MKLSIKLAVIAFCMNLVGCLMPTSELALVNKKRSVSHCFALDFDLVVTKVEERMMKCYAHDTNMAFAGNNSVQKSSNSDDSVSYIYTSKSGLTYYNFRVLIEKGSSEECKVSVTTHTMNRFWDRNSEEMFEWIKGGDPEC